jgi:hypothetical protein
MHFGDAHMAKQNEPIRPKDARGGSRVLDENDAAEFAAAARQYVAANTATPQAARSKLEELGIIDSEGNLTKNYR